MRIAAKKASMKRSESSNVPTSTSRRPAAADSTTQISCSTNKRVPPSSRTDCCEPTHNFAQHNTKHDVIDVGRGVAIQIATVKTGRIRHMYEKKRQPKVESESSLITGPVMLATIPDVSKECPDCTGTFSSDSDLLDHIIETHVTTSDTSLDNNDHIPSSTSPPIVITKRYFCVDSSNSESVSSFSLTSTSISDSNIFLSKENDAFYSKCRVSRPYVPKISSSSNGKSYSQRYISNCKCFETDLNSDLSNNDFNASFETDLNSDLPKNDFNVSFETDSNSDISNNDLNSKFVGGCDTPTDGPAKPFKTFTDKKESLYCKEILEYFEKFDSSDEGISNTRPLYAKGGEVYCFDVRKLGKDYLRDDYHWKNDGIRTYPAKTPDPKLKITTFKCFIDDGQGKKVASNLFTKKSFTLISNPNRVIVHYSGDEKIYKPMPHGNSKTLKMPYLPTCPSVVAKMRDEVKINTPAKVLNKNKAHSASVPAEGVTNARNYNQVNNLRRAALNEKKLGPDSVMNLAEMAAVIEEGKFCQKLEIHPDLMCLFALPKLLDEFEKILKNIKEPILMHYDTTFNIGDFYVSMLVVRHPLLENTSNLCTPAIPIAFLFHERKFTKTHKYFFEQLSESVPILKNTKNAVFITDREKAIIDAIKSSFPNNPLAFCHNHIKQNLKYTVLNRGGSAHDCAFYKHELKSLLDSSSEEDFDKMFRDKSEKWSEAFLDYFKSNLYNDIKNHACRFVVEKFMTYDDWSGITNNASESTNKQLKDFLSEDGRRGELPICVAFFQMYSFLNSFYDDICRGKAMCGPYQLKTKYESQYRIDPDELLLINKHESLAEFVNRMKGQKKDQNSSIIQLNVSNANENEMLDQEQITLGELKLESSHLSSLQRARILVKNNSINYIQSNNVYLVENIDKITYMVKLFPKESCNCQAKKDCYHILAVKIFLDMPIEKKSKSYTLTDLRKNCRSKSDKRSGRKKPRKNDIDPDKNLPASDSIIMKREAVSTSLPPFSNDENDDQYLESLCPPVSPERDEILINTISHTNPTKKRKRSSSKHSSQTKKVKIDTLEIQSRSSILKPGNYIDSETINAAQKIILSQYKNIHGLQDCLLVPEDPKNGRWLYRKKFSPISNYPGAQIHPTGREHWVLSIVMSPPKNNRSEVFLLDSGYFSRSLSPTMLEIQLAALYGKNCDHIVVKRPNIQNQDSDKNNCAFFSIAYLIEYCENNFFDDTFSMDFEFDEDQMRSHLVQCIDNFKFTPFPKLNFLAKRNIEPETMCIKLICICNFPEGFDDNLFLCSKCQNLYHFSCISSEIVHATYSDWCCQMCRFSVSDVDTSESVRLSKRERKPSKKIVANCEYS